MASHHRGRRRSRGARGGRAGINVGEPGARSLGTATPAGQTLVALGKAGVPAGVLDPIEILVRDRAGPALLAPQLSGLPGVRTAVAPDGSTWRRDGTALLSVQPDAEPASPAGVAAIGRVRSFMDHVHGALTGGPGPTMIDENHAFYGRFPLMAGVLALVTIILLARAFGSLLLPVKTVRLNLVSVGHLRRNRPRLAARARLPGDLGPSGDRGDHKLVALITFAFLYGPSMDDEVFILTRAAEERDRTGSTTAGSSAVSAAPAGSSPVLR